MKNNKEGIVVIIVLWVVLGLILFRMINYIQNKENLYEYAQNGTIGVSSKCWLDNGIGYCEIDNKVIRVDNFYEVD